MQRMYEFWANLRIKPPEILQAHAEATVERLKEYPILLAIQDTNELDSANSRRIKKLGSLSHQNAKGLKVHVTSTPFQNATYPLI